MAFALRGQAVEDSGEVGIVQDRDEKLTTRTKWSMRSRLQRINDWETRARDAEYRVANLARNANVTSRQLERYFLRAFDRHPREWLKDLRKKEVLRLRREGLLDKEIARRLGIKQVSHFSRVFGKHRSGRANRSERGRMNKPTRKMSRKDI